MTPGEQRGRSRRDGEGADKNQNARHDDEPPDSSTITMVGVVVAETA
jgi:hypothetical protein